MFDGKAFGQEIVAAVKTYLEREVSAISGRLDAIEKRLDELPEPRDGKDADMAEVRAMIGEELAGLKDAIEAIGPTPELPDIAAMVAEAVAAIPAPENGKDGSSVTIDDVAPLIAAEVEKRVSELPQPKDGKDGKDGESIDPAEVERMVSEQVEKAIASIPAPKDGKDGKDGLDAVSFIRDANDHVIVTMSDGSIRDLGEFKAKDGKDGADGLGFDDMTEELADDGRTIIRRYVRGDQVKEFRHSLAVVLDRGVYQEGAEYKAGDGVTWAGSFWIAQKDTATKPDSGDGWRLAVKRGRDGKPGKDGNPPVPPSPVKLR